MSALWVIGCDWSKVPDPLQTRRLERCLATESVPEGGVIVARGINMLGEPHKLSWGSPDGHVYEVTSDPLSPIDLGHRSAFLGEVWDERFWYRLTCYEDCDNPSSSGSPLAVQRIERTTGKREQLGKSEYGLARIVVLDSFLYLGISGHDAEDGGVRRVHKYSGQYERIPITPHVDPHVKSLTPYKGLGVLVGGEYAVSWIPDGEEKGREIYRSDVSIAAQVLDGKYVYVAVRGRKQDGTQGFIERVSIITGATARLSGPLNEPSAIAVHDQTVYFMLHKSPGVWSVPTTGGEPKLVIPGAAYDVERGEVSLRVWAHPCGLVWLHGNSFPPSTVKTLRYMPWTAI
jgi:hypothetical protein